MTTTTAPTEVAVITISTTERKDVQEEFGLLELYDKMTFTQKIVIGLLCSVVALEGIYFFALVIKYIAEWFILLLVVTRRANQLRIQL
ncbi:hypothetical protein L917_11287 [Phytophthora nicotianae]|uniref:Uncharacterized protein n=1 Tax=Phytophthora nicotianae TaxID=4792 RepID=W2KXH2_PHYNI|nr:hypothetical protein L917_11287 [Phytophthora nicotianae]